jgi:hypothetical protein
MQDEVAAADAGGQTRWLRVRPPFTWLGLLALAWLLIEITRQPALGAIAVCLKFGWEDFLTARWLYATDPHPARRRSTSWLFLAWGLWKTAVVAFLMSVGFALVAPRNPPAALPVALWAFLGSFLTTLVGFGLSALFTGLAVFAAWRGGVRLWLDSAVHRARRASWWPPGPLCEGRTNRLGRLLLTSLGFTTLGVLLVLLAASAGPAGSLVAFVLSVAAPVTLLVSRELIARQVWAETPDECWPDEEDDG